MVNPNLILINYVSLLELVNYDIPTCIDYSSINTVKKSAIEYSGDYRKEYKTENASIFKKLLQEVFRVDKSLMIRNMLLMNILLYSVILILIAKFCWKI